MSITYPQPRDNSFRTDSYNTLRRFLRISDIHRNTQIIVVTMEMYLVREIKKHGHGQEK